MAGIFSSILSPAASGAAPGKGADKEPSSPRLWFHLCSAEAVGPATRLISRLGDEAGLSPFRLFLSAPDGGDAWLRAVVSALPGPEVTRLVGSALLDVLRPSTCRDSLRRWHPHLGVTIGPSPDPTLAQLAQSLAIPLLAVDARFDEIRRRRWPWQRGAHSEKLRAFHRILLQDRASADRLRREDVPFTHLRVLGPMTEVPDPLDYDENERSALAQILARRPVWLAAEPSPDEWPVVLEAHSHALRHAHRMLLILQLPDEASAQAALALVQDGGWAVAQRALDEDPDEEIQILIVAGDTEMGLWYRLAPLCFMGGTLLPDGRPGRSPFEAAALGVAVLHGAATGAGSPVAQSEYLRLMEANASRLVSRADHLGTAVAELIAPDRAAHYALAAWTATTNGAEVLEQTAQEISATLRHELRREASTEIAT